MGTHADLTVKHFGGPLGLTPWKVGGTVRTGIRNPAIRDSVLKMADTCCGDYFWTRPAAKNNRYHPECSCGEGGLIRHVQYACWWGLEMMRSKDVYPEGKSAFDNDAVTIHHDVVLAALIVHDMMKEGDPLHANLPERQGDAGRRLILGCHGVDMAAAILRNVYGGKLENHDQQLIIYSVAGHMGPWTLPNKYAPANIQDPTTRNVAQIVADADYASSRKADGAMSEIISGACSAGAALETIGQKPSAAAA